MNHRRQFIQGAVASGLALMAPRTARAAECRIDVLADEPIGTISPNIYGHFVEHLGGVVYDGIWVGQGSKIPNVDGIRSALVEHMRRIKPGVVRWPGGCFADMYNWRDGIGPRDKRPRRTNFWRDDRGNRSSEEYRKLETGPQKYEPNWFGTNEFMAFCRQTGTQPYFAANVRSLPAQDFQEWVEYANAPAGQTTLSDMRAAAGDREPYRVEFWGVGNESWGCGGRLTPEEYSQEFRRFIAYVPRYGVELKFIAAGPNGGDIAWSRRFFTSMVEKGFNQLNSLYAWALHYYAGTTGKGNVLEYTTDEWYELIARGGPHRHPHRAALGRHGRVRPPASRQAGRGRVGRLAQPAPEPARRLSLRLPGHAARRPGRRPQPGHLQPPCGQSGDGERGPVDQHHPLPVHRLRGQVRGHTQLPRVRDVRRAPGRAVPAHGVLRARRRLQARHLGGAGARAPQQRAGLAQSQAAPGALWGLQGSASLSGKQLTLTVVNPHATEARETEVVVRGATVQSGHALVLTAADIHAHNSFEAPRALEPSRAAVQVQGGRVVHRFPAASVTACSSRWPETERATSMEPLASLSWTAQLAWGGEGTR